MYFKCVSSLGIWLALASTAADAAQIDYQLFEVGGEERKLLAFGTREYGPKDFLLSKANRGGRFYGYEKQLPIVNGFAIGILDTGGNYGGFGITLLRLPPEDPGFSWEWYGPAAFGQFVKRQGRSMVNVKLKAAQSPGEVLTIEFIQDAELRNKSSGVAGLLGLGGQFVLRVKAGSVLEFPPMSGERGTAKPE